MGANLTEKDIEALIAENARLKASLNYYTSGKYGIKRAQIPNEVIEKHGRLDEGVRTKVSWLIRYWLFKDTLSTTSYVAVTRNQGAVKREKNSLISLDSMNDTQYQAYLDAFIRIVNVLDAVKEKIQTYGGYQE